MKLSVATVALTVAIASTSYPAPGGPHHHDVHDPHHGEHFVSIVTTVIIRLFLIMV